MHKRILKGLGIFSEEFDREGFIFGTNSDFWKYAELAVPEDKADIFEVFPELVGQEEDISAVFSTDAGSLKIPAIHRENTFFDLYIFSPLPGTSNAIIVLQDISKNIEHQRIVLQRRNELTFLNREIYLKNTELTEARKTLDRIMEEVRGKTHELSYEVHKKNRELHETRLWFINTLARAAEFREHETGGHLYRIGRSSVLIGQKMGLSTHECEILFYASLLHDVGKIGIPDSILIKPAPLTMYEWDVMRTHTTIGGNLLSRHKHQLFEAARDVALCHHEHWDGTGYPAGLSGHEIPLVARICAVADVYDALVSKRIYKPGWTSIDAVKIVVNGSGSQFDPKVVNAFLNVLPEIQKLETHDSEELEELEPEFV